MALHSALTAGVLSPLTITEDTPGSTFHGGEFVYKLMRKDYAATAGALRTVAADLGIGKSSSDDGGLPLMEDTVDLLYSILLDDERLVPGGKTRFAAGVLLNSNTIGKGSVGQRLKKRLLDANADIRGKEDRGTHSKDILYEVGNLPKVNAAVASHPFTAGAWSAIVLSFKILPKFKKYAEDHGELGKSPILISTCSAKQKMCTYYMPLAKRDKFYMGKQTTEVFAANFDNATWLNMIGIEFDKDDALVIGGWHVRNVFRGIKKAVGLGGGRSGKSADGGDEL